MIENIGFMGAQTGSGGKSGGREIHRPKHHPGGGEIDAAGVHNAEYLGAVRGKVAPVHRYAQSGNAREASGSGHIVEARPGVEVMAAAGAFADGGASAAAAVGEDVATGADDQALRGHFISVGDSDGQVKKKMKVDVTKVTCGALSN